jgi:hypothetical protein
MESANFSNKDEVAIFKADISDIRNSISEGTGNKLELDHLNQIDAVKIITPKPFLKKGEGFIIKKVEGKNEFFKE